MCCGYASANVLSASHPGVGMGVGVGVGVGVRCEVCGVRLCVGVSVCV